MVGNDHVLKDSQKVQVSRERQTFQLSILDTKQNFPRLTVTSGLRHERKSTQRSTRVLQKSRTFAITTSEPGTPEI